MDKKSLPLAKVYGLLEPGPVLLLSTRRGERNNVMAMSWHMMMEFVPPTVGCIVSGRNHSFTALQASGECVLNIPTDELAAQVVGCGNTSGRRTNKFARFGLTAVPASKVAAPLIDECYANLECRVIDRSMVASYNMFILEVVKAWVAPTVSAPRTLHHRGYGSFAVASETIQLPSKMK
jgi:flavin reductase (DIM6/NTAB) family NADH-FMN oxidoreductase RutF